MGALSIAFDITIVGALAVSWVILTVDPFFVTKEQHLRDTLKSMARDVQPGVLAVLLFAVGFFLGSAVSRIAQDFFNDDDLWVELHLPRHSVTEDNIRIHTYCEPAAKAIVEHSLPATLATEVPLDGLCANYAAGPASGVSQSGPSIRDLFQIQESAVLLNGEDKIERLRQYHDQIMVLRGAAFNGGVVFSLCLFAWSAKHRNALGWTAPFFFLGAATVASISHAGGRGFEPPFMEATLFALGGAGLYILKKGVRRNYGTALILSFLITLMAFLGWWWTEVLYDQQVISSFYALTSILTK
jgi:hypothetical protein